MLLNGIVHNFMTHCGIKKFFTQIIIFIREAYMDAIKKGFGRQLKVYRKIRNYTQERLAEKIGVNPRQLARIEAGESFVSSETLLNICKVLLIYPKDLFDYDIEGLCPDAKPNASRSNDGNNYETLKQNLQKIAKNPMKLEFLNLAYNSLYDKAALNELKTMIKGIELIQK